MTSEELTARILRTVGNERQSLVDCIWQLDELQQRGKLGDCPSMWVYCSRVLRLSNGCCTARSHAVKLFRKFPVIAEYLVDGRVSFRKVMLLENVYTKENVVELLEEASRVSEYDVKRMVARALPRPAVPDKLRKKRRSRTSSGEVAPTFAITQTRPPVPASSPLVMSSTAATGETPSASMPASSARANPCEPAIANPATSSSSCVPLVATLTPSASDRPSAGHELGLPLFTGVPANPRSKDVMRPLNETDTEIGFTCDDEFVALFERAKSLLSHKFPRRGHAEVLGECLRIAIDVILKKKLGAGEERSARANPSEPSTTSTSVSKPNAPSVAEAITSPGEVTTSALPTGATESATRSPVPDFTSPDEVTDGRTNEFADPPVPRDLFARPSRYIPKPLMRKIWERDGGCCSFLLEDGTRCGSTYQVEVDHTEPYSLGGPATEENLRLACGPHNRRRSEEFFGSLGRPH